MEHFSYKDGCGIRVLRHSEENLGWRVSVY